MKIKSQLFAVALLCLLLFRCGQNQTSYTTFTDTKLYDNYTLKIPYILNKTEEGKWSTSESSRNLLLVEINTKFKESKSIDEHLESLVNGDPREMFQNKSLTKKDTLTSNGFKGVMATYSKDNSKGLLPVNSYFVFAVLEDGDDIITVKAVTMEKNSILDIKTTIKSIKKIQPDTSNTLSEISNKENSKVTIKKLKHEGYQIFEKDNFALKCPCTLKVNSLFIKEAKKQGNKYPTSAYLCAENQTSYETGVIYNVNAYDITSDYEKIPESKHNYFATQYLASYAENLRTNNINYTEANFNGVKCVEYSFTQMDMPAKAIIFVKNKKSYLLQVATRKDLQKQFSFLKTHFKFIN